MSAVERGKTRGTVLRLWPLALVAGLLAFALAMGWHRHLTLDALVDNREALADFVAGNRVAALLAYGGLYAAAVAVSLPGAAALTVAGGFLFGVLAGGATAALAATLGAVAVFLIARTSLGGALRERAGSRLARIAEGLRADAFSYILFLRLAPVFPFWLVNLAPAIVGVPLRPFLLATAIGILPGTFAIAFLGEGLDSAIAAQAEAAGCAPGAACDVHLTLSALVTPKLGAALAGLGLVALVPVAAKAWRRRRGAHP